MSKSIIYAVKIKNIQNFNLIKIQIIGGGPAGFYTAKKIFQDNPLAHIHIFEKTPFPYGLVRYGVAPDHQSIKKVTKQLSEVGTYANFRFFGNVEIGKDLLIQDLKKHYSAIIYSYGAQNDKKLGIPGEDLKNVFSGRQLVNWYNGHPDYIDLNIDFSKIKNVVIIGNGNVALDVSRTLIKAKNNTLDETDIYTPALKNIKGNNIENIHIVGRRGLIQSQFSAKEFRDFIQNKSANFYILKDEYEKSFNKTSQTEFNDQMFSKTIIARTNYRKQKILNNIPVIDTIKDIKKLNENQINIFLRVLLSPYRVNQQNGQIKSVDFYKNTLQGEPFQQICIQDKSQSVNIQCDLLLRCIGYESYNIDPKYTPWNNQNNTIENSNGCVLSMEDKQKVQLGVYTSGWVKTGPIGILDQTMIGCIETTNNIYNHFRNEVLERKDNKCEHYINQILQEKKIRVVSFQDWLKIDQYELQKGQSKNKIREKICTMQEILKVLE
ncbi:NADPH adrenodoxin oxidoreductase, putative [Ichthyophthirius multifiliis]|uniref:NADPH:adrenodoxin oxidoreductase, mitochondrial n=1 Tax=Ichthyophthirius multifiliis TaxID=5932 RepID=G0R618_ICHMU|nr:NADPH adrenodoxin oxidoreductase, putative [Ichthyophthirius multifiliis]EGR27084.1 NADPH adrenodoxin oxidoreductase, putative [Ichthyophthirius multifiliis]|eukprot:XP_004023968.1 NADPH adrenodoxin oxidoreductase, putative [Ichthyophthirius multifiliis]